MIIISFSFILYWKILHFLLFITPTCIYLLLDYSFMCSLWWGLVSELYNSCAPWTHQRDDVFRKFIGLLCFPFTAQGSCKRISHVSSAWSLKIVTYCKQRGEQQRLGTEDWALPVSSFQSSTETEQVAWLLCPTVLFFLLQKLAYPTMTDVSMNLWT